MKKLFSMVTLFLALFTLTACIEETEEPNDQNPIEQEILLEVTIEIGESVVTHSLPENYEGTLFDLVNEEYSLTYTSSEYGVYLNSLETLTPKNGSYIMISENGEASMVGIDQLTVEDGDTFTFEIVWYDTVLQRIDELITLFLDNHVDTYVTETYIDVNVLSALAILGVSDEVVGEMAVSEMDMVDASLLATTADYFKAIVVMNTLGYDVSGLLADYIQVASTGPYGQTAYGLLLLQMVEGTDVGTFMDTFEQDLVSNTPLSLGLDAGGISLVALADSTFDQKATLVDEYVAWIQSEQLTTGGVKTRDMVWGDTTYPGTENAASMAQVIIGLLANGVDPSGAELTVGEKTLIARLLDFSTDDGAFDYLLDDELDVDMMFSTPQAFLAIVMYQEYKASGESVHPYHID